MNKIQDSVGHASSATKIATFINSVSTHLKAKVGKNEKCIDIVLTLLGITLADVANGRREFKNLNRAGRARLAMAAIGEAIDTLNSRLGFPVDAAFGKALGLTPASARVSQGHHA